MPSAKVGQLLGFKGLTIQRIKEVAGVQRLHIQDKDKVRVQPTVSVQIVGLQPNITHCGRMLEALQAGDQTEIGHLTSYLNVDPQMVGKLMGYRGQTIKEMTEVTGCYIEIQQYPEQGVHDGKPRLFFAGAPEKVDDAVSLAERFIAAPGARLDEFLGAQPPGATATLPPPPPAQPRSAQPRFVGAPRFVAQAPLQQPPRPTTARPGNLGAVAQALLTVLGSRLPPKPAPAPAPVPAAVLRPQGGARQSVSKQQAQSAAVRAAAEPGRDPQEERWVDLPARFKGRLLGLKGTTIDTIRQVSGVVKCHMVEKQAADRGGNLSVQIIGTRGDVDACVKLIDGVLAGDHSGIGHATTCIMVEPSNVGKIMGHKGSTVKELTDRTGCYIEIQQYAEQGVYDGQPKLFLAGPPDKVDMAVNLVHRFIDAPGSRLDAVLTPGGLALPALDPAALAAPAAQLPPLVAPQHRRAELAAPMQPPSAAGTDSSKQALGKLSALSQDYGGPVGAALANLVNALGGKASAAPQVTPQVVSSSSLDGGLVERIAEVPGSKKCHLLGLRGQTIELIRQKSGVQKCHMMDKSAGRSGNVPIQIVGAPDCVEACIAMITGVINGDHSSIGHATEVLPLEAHKVSGLMGHRGQTVTLLKDLTGVYLDIQQGPHCGDPAGGATLFIAGPPSKVNQAKIVVKAFLAMMDHLPRATPGGGSPAAGIDSSMGELLRGLMAGGAGCGLAKPP